MSNQWAHKIGVAGLYLFFATAWNATALANIGLAGMLLAMIIQGRRLKLLLNDTLVKLSFAFLGYLAICTILATLRQPSLEWNKHLAAAFDFYRSGFFLIVIVAFWVAEQNRHIPYLLLLSLAGFIVRIISFTLRGELTPILAGDLHFRLECGMPANALGLFAAVHLWGVVMFFDFVRFRIPVIGRNPANLFIWMITVFILALCVLASQSRGTWLACMVVFSGGLGVCAWQHVIKNKALVSPKLTITTVLALLLAVSFLYVGRPYFLSRMPQEKDSFQAMISGDLSELSRSSRSIGFRFRLWSHGFYRWLEHPLIGWGPAGTKKLLSNVESHGLNTVHPEGIQNYHNTYLEIAINLGITGLAFFLLMWIIVVRGAYFSRRIGLLSEPVFYTLIGAIVLFLIATATNERTGDHFGRFFIAMVGGAAYAGRFSVLLKKNQNNPTGCHVSN